MSDWSRDAAARIKRREDEERIKNETALAQNRLLELNAPALWQRLRELLVQMCNELNSEPAMRDALLLNQKDSNDLRIDYPARNGAISISFDPQRHYVMVSGTMGASYQIRPQLGTQEISFTDGNGMRLQIHEIGRKILNELLRI